MDDWLDDHGGGVDPGQRHEQREGSGYGDDEPKQKIDYMYMYTNGMYTYVIICV